MTKNAKANDMRTKLNLLFFIQFFLLMLPATAFADSCGYLSHHIFFQCQDGRCGKAFFAREFRTRTPCGVKIIVRDIPSGLVHYLSGRDNIQRFIKNNTGVYDLYIKERYSEDRFQSTNIDNIQLQINESKLITRLDGYSSLDEINELWKSKENSGEVDLIVFNLTDGSVFILLLVVFLLSASKIKYAIESKSKGRMLLILRQSLFQILIFCICFLNLTLSLTNLVLINLAMPIMAVVWFCLALRLLYLVVVARIKTINGVAEK